MRRISRGPCCGLVVPGLLLLALAAPARADDETVPTTLESLNRLTGSAPLNGQLRVLLKDSTLAKKLIAEARAALKKKQPLSYNAGLLLALVASELKDLELPESVIEAALASLPAGA